MRTASLPQMAESARKTLAVEPWSLWRQDDNGNRARIETFGTREAALARQAEFESRHHKQIYWVEAA